MKAFIIINIHIIFIIIDFMIITLAIIVTIINIILNTIAIITTMQSYHHFHNWCNFYYFEISFIDEI